MTQLTQTTQHGNLTIQQQLPMPDYKIGEMVARLSLTRVLPNGGTFNEAIAAEYLELLRGLPSFALEKALNDFRQGLAGDGKWMPWPIEIKQHAQTIAAEHNRLEKMAREEKAQVEAIRRWRATGRPERTPEEIAHVEEMAREVRENISARVYEDADDKLERQEQYRAALRREEEFFKDQYQFGPGEKWGWQP